MNTIRNLRELDFTLRKINELRKMCHQLHSLDTAGCNYGLSKRQETRENNLEKRANEIAKELGCKVYRQGDPRGCSLYLIDETIKENQYTDGICLW